MSTEQNKSIVVRFNKECIELGNENSFNELLSDHVINHSAPAGMPNGKESFYYFLNNVLRKGFSNLIVEILDQVAENDLVTTRKKIRATHNGEIFGIPASHKEVDIHVIDIIRIEDGKYAEHWGKVTLIKCLNK
ncbi:ester cyclase [Rhodocytophaga rosea]|uniref:Ester cyclase n=1 Tax=Rhodocytophaga rosea TaxID=2704465 RepID=A0A6C0GF52_9BACT|nr:ester cyclase [Rhodocytophaga rosea]QHT66362.1 ester cyclase [Rhodocytophaga rosea]